MSQFQNLRRRLSKGTQQLSDRLDSLVQQLEESANTAFQSDQHAAIASLIRQHNAQKRKLSKYSEQYRMCKEILVQQEGLRKVDTTVHKAYFGYEGIRFFIRTLQDNFYLAGSEQPSTEKLVVCCYNSAISPMLEIHRQMEAACRALEQETEDNVRKLKIPHYLYKALGYQVCGARLNLLREQIYSGNPENIPEELDSLQRILDANAKALEEIHRQTLPMPVPGELKCAQLRSDLARLLDAEKLQRLSSAEGWTREGYEEAIRGFIRELEEQLLERYQLSGDTETE